MEIDLVTRQDLKELISEEVTSLREALLDEIKRAVEKPYLSNSDLMEITGWSSRTLQHLRDTRQIPFIKHGNKVLYDSSEIHGFLENHKIKSRYHGKGS